MRQACEDQHEFENEGLNVLASLSVSWRIHWKICELVIYVLGGAAQSAIFVNDSPDEVILPYK